MDQQHGVVWSLISILLFHACGEAVKVDIWPKNPLIATGDAAIISCSMTTNGTEDIVNQPYFVFNDSLNITSSTFQVVQLNFSVVQLHLTNVQRHLSGLIVCQLNASSIFISDSTFLTIADKPRKPTGSCRVYNWENMTCSWAAQNDNGVPTNVSLYFSRQHHFTSKELYICPHYNLFEENSCSWLVNDKKDSRDRLMPEIHHWIVLLAENQLGQDYTVTSLYPSNSVQPASVSQLRCDALGSQSGRLHWISPHREKHLYYRVKYSSSWNENEILNVTSRDHDLNVPLNYLSPGTAYWVSVDCKPLVENRQTGFWSKPQTCTFSTNDDVPASTPPVTAGGYRALDQRKEIELFWLPLPKRWANGNVTGYRINISINTEFMTSDPRLASTDSDNSLVNSESYFTQNVTQRSRIIDELVTSWTFPVEEDLSYWITVEAKTSAGFNKSLVPEKIIIPNKNSVPFHPDMYVVTMNSHEHNHFYFNWSAVPTATGYTIYWCNRGQNQPNYCEWETVEPSLTSHHLHLPNRSCESVRFEISVESVLPSGKTVSSGMKPFDVIYFRDGEISLPEDIKFIEDVLPNSQIITWKIPEKEYCQKHAHISHFIIRTCSASADCYERIVDGLARSVKLDGLSLEEMYSIQLKSCSYDRESHFVSTANVSIPSLDAQRSAAAIDASPTTTVIVIICSGVTIALLIIIALCYKFHSASKDTIKIVIPKKLSLSKVEMNTDSSAYYTSQFVSDSLLDVNGCCSVSDITALPDFHDICYSWESDEIAALRHDFTKSSKAAENVNTFSFMPRTLISDVTADSSPLDLSDYHRVMMK